MVNSPNEKLILKHLEELHTGGFTVIREGLSSETIQNVLSSVKGFIKRNSSIFNRHLDTDNHYPRIINLHLAHKELLRLFCESEIALGVQDAFFGRETSIYTSLYYERGSAQPIHRDTPYFCTRPEYQYLGVWVALEPANELNGCLEVVKYGHQIPELDREKLALRFFDDLDSVPSSSQILWDTYQDEVFLQCKNAGLSTEKVFANAGDIVIWHPQLPHGGSEIKDISKTRHSLVMHTTPVGTPVYHQNVFFNPNIKVSDQSPWGYENWGGRKYALHNSIEFGHQDPQPPSAFI